MNEQISINTATLNKIDAIRNSHRKEAMREFDDWRSKAELPFLPSIEGEIQENRKAYKYSCHQRNKIPFTIFQFE